VYVEARSRSGDRLGERRSSAPRSLEEAFVRICLRASANTFAKVERIGGFGKAYEVRMSDL
jgi:hypothetical protein